MIRIANKNMDQFVAAEEGNVEWFLSNKFDVDEQDAFGSTALIIAVYRGNGDVVRLLLSYAPRLDITGPYGNSVLKMSKWDSINHIKWQLSLKDITMPPHNVSHIINKMLEDHLEILYDLNKWQCAPRTLKYIVQNAIERLGVEISNNVLLKRNDFDKETTVLILGNCLGV